jgi:hypothetical protein
MAVHLQGRVPAQEPGAAVRYLDRLADRPSERRFRGGHAAKSTSETCRVGGMASKRPANGAEAAEQGVLRAQRRILVMALGCEPERPAPPRFPSGGAPPRGSPCW